MIVESLTVGLLHANCYVLGCETTRAGVIIDPGDEPRAILRMVQQHDLSIEKIILTHAHFDHVLALDAVRQLTNATVYLHRDDLPTFHDVPEHVQLWLDWETEPLEDPDEFMAHGDILTFGNEALEVRFTPGHAPGHVSLVHHAGRQVFAGDTLFSGSMGRYDLPGADGPTLLRSIHEQLLALPDDYTVHPGHGPATTIGSERELNPFVGRIATR
ncbi:MAG: MBL fold metallo-hydrolase [Litorilinea sp.]